MTALASRLPAEQSAEIVEVHRELAQAAASAKPEAGRLRTAAERLSRFAKAAGDLGAPVIEAIHKLLAASGVLS